METTVAWVNRFTGNIAHLQAWDRELSKQEIEQATYHPGSVTDGLTAHFPFYEASQLLMMADPSSWTPSIVTHGERKEYECSDEKLRDLRRTIFTHMDRQFKGG